MSKLIELPTGDWVDPNAVISIQLLPEELKERGSGEMYTRPATVRFDVGQACYLQEYADNTEAQDMRTYWAQKINQLRA